MKTGLFVGIRLLLLAIGCVCLIACRSGGGSAQPAPAPSDLETDVDELDLQINESSDVIVTVLGNEGAPKANIRVHASTNSGSASVEPSEAVTDASGQARFRVTGQRSGVEVIIFELIESDLASASEESIPGQAEVVVHVGDEASP